MSPFEAKHMQGPFELSEYYVDMLKHLGHGEGLLRLSNAMLKVWIRIPQGIGIFLAPTPPCRIEVTGD